MTLSMLIKIIVTTFYLSMVLVMFLARNDLIKKKGGVFLADELGFITMYCAFIIGIIGWWR